MAAPKKVDYERIEPGWRAGLLSPTQLAAEYTEATGINVSRAAIIKHFGKLGVPRDLRAKVMAKADSMVAEAMVTGKVSTATTLRDAEVIDDSAARVATVRLGHRKDIGRGRSLTMAMFEELEGITSDPDAFERLGEMMIDPEVDKNGRLQALFDKTISLPGRADTLKKLADSLRILIDKEREAYNIDAANSSKSDYEDTLAKVAALAAP